MISDHDVSSPPAAREFRGQIGADAPVKLEDERFVRRAAIEIAIRDCFLRRLDSRRQVGRQLGVAEDAERSIQITGCRVRRSSSLSSIR